MCSVYYEHMDSMTKAYSIHVLYYCSDIDSPHDTIDKESIK